MMRTAYGFDDVRQNESLVRDAVTLSSAFIEAAIPGKFLVNIFPVLKHVPSWFPGAGFQKYFAGLAQLSSNTVHSPFEEAKHDYVGSLFASLIWPAVSREFFQEHGRRGKHPSVAADLIDGFPDENAPNRAELEAVARGVCSVTYFGMSVDLKFGSCAERG